MEADLALLSLGERAWDASSLSRDALAQNDRQYTDGPVTDVTSIRVEYGHFEDYLAWLNSTWKPTMETMKRAGLILDSRVFQATPRSQHQPNIYLMITYRYAAAALDHGVDSNLQGWTAVQSATAGGDFLPVQNALAAIAWRGAIDARGLAMARTTQAHAYITTDLQ